MNRRCPSHDGLGRTGQQRAAPALIGRGQLRLEQLPHDPEPELVLQRRTAGTEHSESTRAGERSGLFEQRGLTDTHITLDQPDRAPPFAGSLDHSPQALELAFPLQQHRGPPDPRRTRRGYAAATSSPAIVHDQGTCVRASG